MTVTRRQFAMSILASFFASDPVQEIAHVLQKATSPGWFTPPEITASVIDLCYGPQRLTRAFGAATTVETPFIISSITKPMIATAVMLLQDRKLLSVQDRVIKFLPEFRGDLREDVTIQHLLTHTAGLPDNLSNIRDLLRRQATWEEIFLQTCKTPLLFQPGTAFSYSNLGVLVAKKILERATRVDLRVFLEKEVFQPLSMDATTLGPAPGKPAVRNQQRPDKSDVNKSSDMATPWGGVHSTALDVTRLLRYFSNPTNQPLRPETALSMLQNHNQGLDQPWGIGWMLAKSHDAYYKVRPTWRRYGWSSLLSNPERLPAFGIDCSPRTFGHYGVTGTLAWADPQRHISLVLLTTKAVRHSRDGVLGTISDIASRLA